MKNTLTLLAAVSTFAFTANTNAADYTPYVAADYTYSDIQNLAEEIGRAHV